MNIKVFQNRKVSKDYFDNEGTQNENYSTTLSFEFPLGYEDFSKRIVFITEDGNFWDYIKDNEYVIKNNITKYENVEAYLWLTKDNQDFRSETFELNFYENQNPDNMTPSEEQLDGYNTLIAELELKVEEVDALKEETLEALEKLKEQQIDYENRFEEINDMLKELKDTNEYQSEIIDQFKNEFDEKEFEGASAHLPDSAELPLKLQPQGNIEQVVVEEIPGTTVSGELINITDGDSTKEVKAVIDGNSYQETRVGYNLAKSINDYAWFSNSNASFEIIEDYIKVTLPEKPSQYSGVYSFDMKSILADYIGQKGYFSFYAKADSSRTIRISPLGTIKQQDITLTTEWQRFSVAIDSIVEENCTFYCGTSLSTVPYYIKDIMFELGDTLHDYEDYGSKPSIDFPSDIEVIDMVNHLDIADKEYRLTNNSILTVKDGICELKMASGISANFGQAINLKTPIKLLANTKYTVYNGFSTYPYITLKDVNNNSVVGISYDDNGFKTFTVNEDTIITNINLWFNYANGDITFKPMLVKGSYTLETMPPFLPYGCIGLLQRKQGLFNAEFRQGSVSQSNRADRLFSTQELKFETTKTYSVLTNLDLSKYKYALALATNKFPTDAFFYDSGWITQRTFTFSTTQEGYFGIGIAKVDNTALTPEEMTNYYFIVDEVENATDLEPIVHSIDLAGNSIAKVGDIKDLLNIGLDGSVSIEKKTIFDSFNTFSGSNVYKNTTYADNNIQRYTFVNNGTYVKHKGASVPCLCTHFKNTQARWGTPTETGFFNWENNNAYGLDLPLDQYDTVDKVIELLKSLEDFKIATWLQTSDTISLPSIEPIKLFEGTNNFELVTNLDTTINMTYNHVGYSPSIVKPSEVKGVSGHYDTVVENKQLFKKYTDTGSLTANGVEITNNADGSFTLNGTCTQNSWVEVVTAFKNGTVEQKTPKYLLNEEETYTFSLTKISGSVSNSAISAFLQANTTGSFGVSETKNQIQVKGNGVYRSWIYLAKDVVFNNYVFALQLEVGDTKTDYTPHQEQLLPIDIPFNMYSGKPYKENGKWYRPIEYKKYEFTGNEIFSFGTSSTGLKFFNCNETFKDNGSTMLYMNYFRKISKSFSQLTEKGDYCTWGTREPTRLAIMCKDYDTIEDFTAWLKEQYNNGTPLYVIYKLATPTIEEITDTTLIEQLENIQRAFSYYPVTNVNSYKPTVNVADLILNGKYYVSNKAKFKTLEERVSALENETVNE